MAQHTAITTAGTKILAARAQHTTPGGATNSPPTLGSEAPGYGICMGVGASAGGVSAAIGDLSLFQEVETRGNGAETITNAVYQSVGTQSATATRVIDETGMIDTRTQSTTINGAVSQNAATVTLTSGAVFGTPATIYTYDTKAAVNSYQTLIGTISSNTFTVTTGPGTGGNTADSAASGQWITSQNLFARVTLVSATITLNNGDSLQVTYQVTFTTSTT